MAKELEVCKCELCGNTIELLTGGAGEPVCCGKYGLRKAQGLRC